MKGYLFKKHLFLIILLATLSLVTLQAQVREPKIYLWGKDAPLQKQWTTLTPYLPQTEAELEAQGAQTPAKRPAIIVCPGGSYRWLDKQTEGHGVAQWLSTNGFVAFVLQYRVASRGNAYPAMIEDAQNAIAWVKMHASTYGIDTTRIGVMGFSAGGHLAGLTNTYGHHNFLRQRVPCSLQPNFVCMVYPVITTTDRSLRHGRSRRAMLGQTGTASTQDSLSLELHVTPGMSPVFLINCVDDPTVKYRNSVVYDSVLTRQGIVHEYHQYQKGGHGFGADDTKAGPEARQWKAAFLQWYDRTLREGTNLQISK